MLPLLVIGTVISGLLIVGCYFIGTRRTMVRAVRDGTPFAGVVDAAPYGRYFVVAVCGPAFLFCLAWAAFHTPYLAYRVVQAVPPPYWSERATDSSQFLREIRQLSAAGFEAEMQKPEPDEVMLQAASDYSIVFRYLYYLLWIGASFIILVAYVLARRNLRPGFDAKAATGRVFRRYALLAAPIAAYMLIAGDKHWNLW